MQVNLDKSHMNIIFTGTNTTQKFGYKNIEEEEYRLVIRLQFKYDSVSLISGMHRKWNKPFEDICNMYKEAGK